jgi:predicted nucleic acid-binding protein
VIEAGYSARSPADLRRIRRVIGLSMESVPCDELTWELAFEAQRAMADATGLMHRRKPLDLLIAATAHQHGLGVLHYDRDYDFIAEHGGLQFASVWVVAPGSLER